MSAGTSSVGRDLYEFGPFRVDAEKEILSRDGEPVPLTPKTFQILLVLVRRAQEVVSKDDLMKSVWPDTFVEEANLSRNIFMLRKALGESPQDHRYVLTVPGRGYRLAEAVRVVPQTEVSIVAATQSRVQIEVKESRPWAWVLAVAMVLLLAAAGTSWFRSHRRPVLTPKDTVVLADFSNSTGDAVFDETLRQGLAVQLEESPFLRLIFDARIQQTLKLMGQPANAHLTPAIAKEICERTGSAAVLEGSIAPLGSEYVLALRARSCSGGNVLREEQVEAKRKEDVLAALGKMSSEFRKHLGETRDTIEKYDTPLAEASTPSLEALKSYSMGLKVIHSAGSAVAAPFFQNAVEIDPNFALAHAFLGRMYGDLGEFERSAASTTRAYELRERASDRERFLISASYEMQVTGNLEKAQQVVEAWQRSYPRDPIPHSFLSGIIYPALGKYELAAEQGSKVIELDPDFPIGYSIYAFALAELERVREADDTLRRAAARGLEIPEITVQRYDFAFLRGDEAGLQQIALEAKPQSDAEAWIADHEAFVAAYHGRMHEAHRLSEHAVALTQQVAEHERAAQFEAGEAVRQALLGNSAAARQSATAALHISHDRDVEYGAALAFAMSRDLPRAQILLSDLETRFPEDTSVKFSYSPSLRALLALQRNAPAKAVEELQVASNYELGSPRSSQHAFFGALYPIYIRGQAYLSEKDGAAARAEFQKIIDHPGIVVSDSIGALAHLQQARACALSNDNAAAKAEYQKFFILWKDADPGLDILKQAKSEFAKL